MKYNNRQHVNFILDVFIFLLQRSRNYKAMASSPIVSQIRHKHDKAAEAEKE
jgi:hypothetical protein